jgi:cbb3-type cytochrome oxidase subunit 3
MNASGNGVEPAAGPNRVSGLQRAFVFGLALWVFVRTTVVAIAFWPHPIMRAVAGMAWGLILLWIVLGGGVMYLFRDRIKASLKPARLNWRISFFLLATLLAMCEEAVTTLMTNCAPIFGVKMGQAYITASANYFDVVCCHSVITFLPAFAAWAWLFSRHDFSPFEAFVCFGIYGDIGEAIFGGFHLADVPFWIFVYGLMIYLPAYVFADHRGTRRVSWLQYLMGAVGPFVCTVPWVVLLKLTFLRHHPDIHFPPIQPN